MPDYSYELKANECGFLNVCGVDEAGRGPLAGPVCAAAVILPAGVQIERLDDSKKLSEKKREELFDVIKSVAVSYCVAYASVEEIEEQNILNATFTAMKRAIAGLEVKPDYALIDGNRAPGDMDIKYETIIKGDGISMSIAAASILAKVSRDRLMLQIDKEFPEYNFKKHKGYGTAEHIALIKKYGISPHHRKSFLKKI